MLQYTPDISEETVLTLGASCSKTIKQTKSSSESVLSGVVGLCAPVQLAIMPKQGFR